MIEKFITSTQALGFKINNFFQRDDGFWQANLRKVDGDCYEWGRGATPEAALDAALKAAQNLPGVGRGKSTATYVQPTFVSPPIQKGKTAAAFESLFPAAFPGETKQERAARMLAELDLSKGDVP